MRTVTAIMIATLGCAGGGPYVVDVQPLSDGSLLVKKCRALAGGGRTYNTRCQDVVVPVANVPTGESK